MKSIRQTRSRYPKRKTLRQKRSRSRRTTRRTRIRSRSRSSRTPTRKIRRSIRRQRGGQTTSAITTSAGCQIRAPLVDNDALAMQLHHPTPNITQPQSNSNNNYALVNDRSQLYVKM